MWPTVWKIAWKVVRRKWANYSHKSETAYYGSSSVWFNGVVEFEHQRPMRCYLISEELLILLFVYFTHRTVVGLLECVYMIYPVDYVRCAVAFLLWLCQNRAFCDLFTCTVETLYSTIYYSKYFIELNFDKSTQYVALWTHKRHPIPRPFGRAMECLLWVLEQKLIVLYTCSTIFQS